MQRHLKLTPVQVTLSVEEEAILVDEQNQSTHELVSLQADVTRIAETGNIFTDIPSILAQVPTVGETETEIIDAIGDMAVAGTDVDAGELLYEYRDPSGIVNANESFLNKALEKAKKELADREMLVKNK